MGIPEVWRVEDRVLQFLHLQAVGRYEPREVSRAFPGLTVAKLGEYLGFARIQKQADRVK